MWHESLSPHKFRGRGAGSCCGKRLPDVYDELLAAGVAEAPLTTQMPPSLPDRTARDGDERLTLLMTRRSTFDWVLRRSVLAQAGATVQGRVQVRGLLAVPGEPPHVIGVRTDQGEMRADLVVDASGRRSTIDRWLMAIGARATVMAWAECGLACYSRHYMYRGAAAPPGSRATRIVVGLDEFTAVLLPADNGVLQLAVLPLVEDKRFRAVRHPEVFTAVLRTVPPFAARLDALDPISLVFPMGGLHNTLRRLVVDGVPVATGLLAVGDSVCTTNPTLARGLSLALQGAADLVDVIRQHGEDRTALALALEEKVSDHIEPFYTDQAAIDSGRLAMLRHTIFGAPAPPKG